MRRWILAAAIACGLSTVALPAAAQTGASCPGVMTDGACYVTGTDQSTNPNIGTTYNSYPPGDYYSDYGFPTLVSALPRPLVVRSYYGVPYAAYPCCPPAYVPWR